MCSKAERKRRAAVTATRVKIKVLVNGQEVGASKSAPLQFPSFSAPVALSLSLSLRRRPKSVEFQVWQAGWLWGTKLASMAVPIPGTMPQLSPGCCSRAVMPDVAADVGAAAQDCPRETV